MPFAAPQENDLTPGFMVVHGNRLEDLRGVAVEWMKRHPLAPLENETILVQSNGIGQWMKLALAADEVVTLLDESDGIIAVKDIDRLTPRNSRLFIGFISRATPITGWKSEAIADCTA